MGFSRQAYWSGLPLPSPGDLPDPGIEPRSPTLQANSLPSEPTGRQKKIKTNNSEYEEVAAVGTWGSILLGTLWGTTLDNCRHFPTNEWRNWPICTLPLILIGWGPPVGRVSHQPFQFALHLSWTSPMVPERTFGPRERGPHTEMGTSCLSQVLVKAEEGTGGWAGYSYNILFFIWFPGVQCIF